MADSYVVGGTEVYPLEEETVRDFAIRVVGIAQTHQIKFSACLGGTIVEVTPDKTVEEIYKNLTACPF